ncbi:MAG: alcohol dehydrogenase catalytic domain-containing protein [Candidatus Bathyarchaeota archaeon]|nr:alcohol dehydrogenase catalytic domain-containing protein [Candidatus Bathyarchaeota archaeon]
MEVWFQHEKGVTLYKRQSRLTLKPGDIYKEKNRKAKVEGVALGGMNALVYYGAGDFRVVRNRPIFYTSNDLIVKVDMVHRCGTDARYYREGHRFIDSILLTEFGDLTDLKGSFDPLKLEEYVHFLETGEANRQVEDELYRNLAKYWGTLNKEQRAHLAGSLFTEWGRIPGHEIVGTIEKVGSNVKNLTKPLGYTSTWLSLLPEEYLNFKKGERVILQTRCARYRDPPKFLQKGNVAGIQLLGMDIEDGARTIDGGFAQYMRITSELIQSGCVIRVPDGIGDTEAALVEPTACLIDCLDLAVHPEGQDERGNIMKKGVRRGGVTAIVGSGAMAFIAAELALAADEKMQVGGASKVIMFVRSEEKAALGQRLLGSKFGGKIGYFIYDSNRPHEENVRKFREEYGKSSIADDVIIAAGDIRAIELAHRLVSGTGWRIHAFAGTSGGIRVESGIWHYSNAGTSGTSGCNTRAMENVLRMIERGTIELSRFSGNKYTFADLQRNPGRFFTDRYLRPALLPNKGVSDIEWLAS